MAPVLEIATIPLKPGLRLEEAGSDASNTLRDLVKTIRSQPGCRHLYWSREVENPDNLRWLVDWESIEAHHRAEKSDDWDAVLEGFDKIRGGDAVKFHTTFPTPWDRSLNSSTSPTTEIASFYFPKDLSEEKVKDFEDRFTKLLGVLEQIPDLCTASSGGWAVEEVDVPDKEEKAKLFIWLVGWKSVEAHGEARQKKAFVDNIHLLREVFPSMLHRFVVHIHSEGS